MDIYDAISTLEAEMGLKFSRIDNQVFYDGRTLGAKLKVDNSVYGAIVFAKDEKGEMLSCAYVGKYPGQTDVEDPELENRGCIVLDLDQRVIPGSKDNTPKLVRIDGNPVPFLGVDEFYELTPQVGGKFMSRTSELAQDLYTNPRFK